MEDKKEMTIHLPEEVLSDIDNLIKYKEYRRIVFNKKEEEHTAEEFVIGCIKQYLDELKEEESVLGVNDPVMPFSLKNNIKEYMEEIGCNQKKLSELTGIRPSNLSQIMNNKTQPSLDYFFRIWVALKQPLFSKILYREESSKITKNKS